MTLSQTTDATTLIPNFFHFLSNDDTLQSLKAGRQLMQSFNEQQFEKFDNGVVIEALMRERASYIDQLLKKIWVHFLPNHATDNLTLIAVGGYGRGELEPYSDIDLLILGNDYKQNNDAICQFITYLWDLGFEVGHAVRTLEECKSAAKEDVSTATNLLEARWLLGDYDAFQSLQQLFNLDDFWPSEDFFKAKLQEQENRHKRYNNTLYQLEPNIKESPGGLRDIQTILWVAKRHYGADSILELMQHNFISLQEYREIQAAYFYLNRVRFALHRLKKRHEDRLLFDHQQQLASNQSDEDEDMVKAVEAFMKPYYQNVHIVARLNEILLQHFREEIFDHGNIHIKQLNPRFQIINNYLDVISETLFENNPTALFEVFILIQNFQHLIHGIRSRTIRLIRNNLHLINDEFRSDPINKALFIEIFRQPKGVNASLKRMHGYGILAAYLPAFKKISGLMQFNIFHAYTVDEHTILVIRNLRRFFVDQFEYEFPAAHQIAKQLCKPEILLLSGLFHDIAKGRNGKHEILGAVDAQEFAFKHNLSEKDSELLSWLVRNHLEFSFVAQKKDISNPEIIGEFAKKIGTQEKLDYLYLLTVADVRSTSDEVLNDWKKQLFLQLYRNTTQALDQSSATPRNRAKQIIFNQEKAKELLQNSGISPKYFKSFWQTFENTGFFNRQTAIEIAQITELLHDKNLDKITVEIQPKSNRGATELILYMQDKNYLFAQLTHTLDRLSLNIMEAKIYSGSNHTTLAIIYLLDGQNQIITDGHTLKELKNTLTLKFAQNDNDERSYQKEPRRIRAFDTPTEIGFAEAPNGLTELTIHAKDIPGLLAKIGQAFKVFHIRVYDAKVNTVGEKAEDVFLIGSTNGQDLTDHNVQEQFKAALLQQF